MTELGASTFLPTPSYQLDRGLFENALAERAVEQGCRFVDGAVVRRFSLPRRDGEGSELHRISYEHDGAMHDVTARWLVDAAGRAGLDQAQARARGGQRPRGRRCMVPHRRAHRRRRLVDRSRLAGTDQSAEPVALDQSSVRRRILGLADSAGLRRTFRRHRRGQRGASDGDARHVREVDGLAAQAPAATSSGPREQARQADGFRLSQAVLARLQAGFLRQAALGAHRRGRASSSIPSIRRAATSSRLPTPSSPR